MKDQAGRPLEREPGRGRARMSSRDAPKWCRLLSLILPNGRFTMVVPGAGGWLDPGTPW